MALTARDRAILDFEREWWQLPGSKEQAIRSRFGFSPTQYYRRLAALIDDDDASGYDPLTVKRLQRGRDRRRRMRIEGRRADPGSR